jgi:hypothetical protein
MSEFLYVFQQCVATTSVTNGKHINGKHMSASMIVCVSFYFFKILLIHLWSLDPNKAVSATFIWNLIKNQSVENFDKKTFKNNIYLLYSIESRACHIAMIQGSFLLHSLKGKVSFCSYWQACRYCFSFSYLFLCCSLILTRLWLW